MLNHYIPKYIRNHQVVILYMSLLCVASYTLQYYNASISVANND